MKTTHKNVNINKQIYCRRLLILLSLVCVFGCSCSKSTKESAIYENSALIKEDLIVLTSENNSINEREMNPLSEEDNAKSEEDHTIYNADYIKALPYLTNTAFIDGHSQERNRIIVRDQCYSQIGEYSFALCEYPQEYEWLLAPGLVYTQWENYIMATQGNEVIIYNIDTDEKR